MNGVATQRYASMDYHSVSRRHDAVSSTLGPPWYPDDRTEFDPRQRAADPARSLLLDIPATSGPRSGPPPPGTGSQHLLTVGPPPQQPPPPPIDDASAINPQLRHAQKAGELYNISVDLNALQLAARPPSAGDNETTLRRARSMQDLAAGWSYRPPSTPLSDDPEGGTTVIHVRHGDEADSPPSASTTTSTLPITQRPTARTSRPPSVHTLQIPPSSGRRSRSASRGPDEGYVIKSLKSTGDGDPPGPAGTQLAGVVGDSKVEFDVELTQQQLQQQQQQYWETEQSSSQHILNLTSGHRSLLIESVTPSTRPTSSRQMLDPDNTAEPDYTMTMNQRMTMNYEPPLPSPRPTDIIDETVQHRTTNVVSSGRPSSHYEVMAVDDAYLAGGYAPPPPVRTKKKKKKPQMVNSGTQMAPKTRDIPDDDVTKKKKRITETPPRRTQEPRMVNSSTQMAIDKSTQMVTKTTDIFDVTDAFDYEEKTRKKLVGESPPRRTPEPRMVDSATYMMFDKSTQIVSKTRDVDETWDVIDDEESMRKKRLGRSPPRITPEPDMVSRWTQMGVNKSTQVRKSKDDTDGATTTSSDDEVASKRARKAATRNKTTDDRTASDVVTIRHSTRTDQDDRRHRGSPVNGYTDDKENQPWRRERGNRVSTKDRESLRTTQLETTTYSTVRDERADVTPPESEEEQVQEPVRRRVENTLPTDWEDTRTTEIEKTMTTVRGETAVLELEGGAGVTPPESEEDEPVRARRRGQGEDPSDWTDWPPTAAGRRSPDSRGSPRYRGEDLDVVDRGPDGRGPVGDVRPGRATDARDLRGANVGHSSYADDYDSRRTDEDRERFVNIPVTSSGAFDERDEDYLRRRRANKVSARQSHSRSTAVTKQPTVRQEEAKALLESATRRIGAVETHFGYEGSREAFVERLMRGAPKGSVMQFEHTQREEEEILGSQLSRYSYEHAGADAADDSSMLNFDTVSEKVELSVASGMAELMVKVRCERIVPVQGGVADLFKKTSVIVTRVIEVNLSVTSDRQQLYEHILDQQRLSTTGRLSTKDTFDLYKTFMAMAAADEASGRQRPHEVRIDQQVDEQRMLDLQLTASRLSVLPVTESASDFRRVDSRLSDVYADDVDIRSRGHSRPVDTGGHSMSTSMSSAAASRSRQLYYGTGHDGYVARSRYS